MITDLWIENFKGIGKRQHIPLRPITLLFGANSAGKSTVMHALLYLREVLCNQNLNPTKPIAGENTVNLGGLDNILHRQTTEAVEPFTMRLHCRFTPSWRTASQIWEKRFYDRQTTFYFVPKHLASDRHVTSKGFQQNDELNYDSEWFAPKTCEISIRIAAPASHGVMSVNGFTFLVDDVPLLSSDGSGCWLNMFNERLKPSPEGFGVSGPNELWHSHRVKCLEILNQRLAATHSLGQPLLELEAELLHKSRFVIVTDPLQCPTLMNEVSGLTLAIFRYGHAPYSPELRLVSMEAVLQLCERNANSRLVADETFSDVMVAIDETETRLDGTSHSCLDSLKFVAVPAARSKELPRIVAMLRTAFLREALAGDFLINLDKVNLPGEDCPLLNMTDAIGATVGDSLSEMYTAVCLWFPDQLARVDQTIRIAISQLRDHLKSLCYIGPKRSMVPRNLTKNVLDEYAEWGNGLGAWRWLLNRTECPNTTFSKCSNWLSNIQHGFGTGYLLMRDGIYEMSAQQMKQYYEEGFDIETMKYSIRIELHDCRTGTARQPQDVGEGITQLVPVVAASVRTSQDSNGGQLVAIEQPELHLHPSLAARIGDLLISCSFPQGVSPFRADPAFLIETHSEHLILRILRRIRQTTDGELPEHIPPVKPDEVCVLWVDNLGDGTTFQRLRIDDQGEFIDRWPRGFFSERAEELY